MKKRGKEKYWLSDAWIDDNIDQRRVAKDGRSIFKVLLMLRDSRLKEE